MRIVVLVENHEREGLIHEHGLSLYIETKHHKILMDTGQSDAFIHNALSLGIDLSRVDICIISHGHYDHGGGLQAFYAMNKKAIIYMHKDACQAFYHHEKYIGLNDVSNISTIQYISHDVRIDDEISILTNLSGNYPLSIQNKVFSIQRENSRIEDIFKHEIALSIKENKEVLCSGCAHNGILNILDRYHQQYHHMPDIVCSGFHLKQKQYTKQDDIYIEQLANILCKYPTIFYSGHCSGDHAMDIMSKVMNDKLKNMYTGSVILIESSSVE